MFTYGPDGTAILFIITALLILPSNRVRTSCLRLPLPETVFSLWQVAIQTRDGNEG